MDGVELVLSGDNHRNLAWRARHFYSVFSVDIKNTALAFFFFILVIIALMFEERFYCKLPTITVLNGKSAHKFLHPSLNLCFISFLLLFFFCSLLHLLSRAALFVSLSFSNSNCCYFLSLSLEFSRVTTLSLFIPCALLSFQVPHSFFLKWLLSLS